MNNMEKIILNALLSKSSSQYNINNIFDTVELENSMALSFIMNLFINYKKDIDFNIYIYIKFFGNSDADNQYKFLFSSSTSDILKNIKSDINFNNNEPRDRTRMRLDLNIKELGLPWPGDYQFEFFGIEKAKDIKKFENNNVRYITMFKDTDKYLLNYIPLKVIKKS